MIVGSTLSMSLCRLIALLARKDQQRTTVAAVGARLGLSPLASHTSLFAKSLLDASSSSGPSAGPVGTSHVVTMVLIFTAPMAVSRRRILVQQLW